MPSLAATPPDPTQLLTQRSGQPRRSHRDNLAAVFHRYETLLVEDVTSKQADGERDARGVAPLPRRTLAPRLDVRGDHKLHRELTSADGTSLTFALLEQLRSQESLLGSSTDGLLPIQWSREARDSLELILLRWG